MNCHEVQEHLSAWMDGEAPEELRQPLADHLAGCPACRAELAMLERLHEALGGLEVPVPRDRRRYIDLPSASFELLLRAPSSKRETRYRQLLEQAHRIAAARLAGRARAA